MLAMDDFLLLRPGLYPGAKGADPPAVRTRGPNFPHGPPRNGVLSSDPWQKIRKTAANGKHNDEVQLRAFDVLAMDGDDLRNLPLSMRKTNLARLLHGRPGGIFISDFEQGEIGPDLFRKACEFGLEGLVSKHRDRPYQAGRSKHWIKVKNRKHQAFDRVKEPFA